MRTFLFRIVPILIRKSVTITATAVTMVAPIPRLSTRYSRLPPSPSQRLFCRLFRTHDLGPQSSNKRVPRQFFLPIQSLQHEAGLVKSWSCTGCAFIPISLRRFPLPCD